MKYIIIWLLDLWLLVFVVRVVLTWIPYRPAWKGLYNFLDRLVNPVMDKVYQIFGRNLILGNVDATPLVVYALVRLIRYGLIVIL